MTLEEAIKHCEEVANDMARCCDECAEEHRQLLEWLKELKVFHESFGINNIGDFSDGYHTFNQLYHQRAILFATIVNQNKDKAWKSFKHEDGKYCFDKNGEWFIVGIDTPEGSYTYHYEKKYWNYFKCKELEIAKHWDGHTEEDVTRLLSLQKESCEDCISRQDAENTAEWILNRKTSNFECDKCNYSAVLKFKHCPNCGRRMKGEYK